MPPPSQDSPISAVFRKTKGRKSPGRVYRQEGGNPCAAGKPTEKKRPCANGVFVFCLVFGSSARCFVPPPSGPSGHGRIPSYNSDIDPAAGSPTATLLRLLLPLAEEHHPALIGTCPFSTCFYPNAIGSNDGRCVQMAGTQSIQADDLGILGIPRSRDTVAIIYPHHVSGLQGFPASSGHGAVGEPLPSCWLLHRISVVRVRPRTSGSITDLLLPLACSAFLSVKQHLREDFLVGSRGNQPAIGWRIPSEDRATSMLFSGTALQMRARV